MNQQTDQLAAADSSGAKSNALGGERRISNNQELETHAAKHVMVYDSVNEEFIAADQSAKIHQINLPSEQQVNGVSSLDRLATKFFIYKHEGDDNGSTSTDFKKTSEQEIVIASEVQSPPGEDSDENKKHGKSHQLQPLSYFADTWSILRFIKGNKSQGVQLSPDGLTLSITHSHKGQAQQDELVLTNMAFTSGLHFWEVLATISCSNLQVGVHNPVTKTDALTNFRTSSPRTITVCLDINEGTLKFWLNGTRFNKKTINLTPRGGPWIPCVRISKEGNTVQLNPFAKEPAQFYEFTQDRFTKIDQLLMPLLQNSICVTKLPPIKASTVEETVNVLTQLFSHSQSNISKIHMPELGADNMFCLIKFHHHTSMVEFLHKHQKSDKTFEIFDASQILHWFEQETISSDVQEYFDLVKKGLLRISEETQERAINAIKAAKSALESLDFTAQTAEELAVREETNPIQITQQVFTDKLLISKCTTGQVKSVTRDLSDERFHLDEIDFTDDSWSQNTEALLQVNRFELIRLLKQVQWQKVFANFGKEDHKETYLDKIMSGFIFDFFTSLAYTVKIVPSEPTKATLFAPIYSAKVVIDFMQHQVRQQLSKVARTMRNFAPGIDYRDSGEEAKPFQPLPENASLSTTLGFSPSQASVDELESMLQLLTDVQEQFWAKTRSDQCPTEIKQIFTNICRPYSALNRLGTFIQWPFNTEQSHSQNLYDLSPSRLCENGLYLRADNILTMYQNDNLRMDSLSADVRILGSEKAQKQAIGSSLKILKGLPSRSVPLSKSLNYLCPQKFISVSEVITSQNSGFVLIGGKSGAISLCSSALTLTPLKAMQFFTHDVDKKLQKSQQLIQQLEARYQAYITMQQNLCKKDQPVTFITDPQILQGKDSSKKSKTSKSKKCGKKKKAKKSKAEYSEMPPPPVPVLFENAEVESIPPQPTLFSIEEEEEPPKEQASEVPLEEETGQQLTDFLESLNIETEVETVESAPITKTDQAKVIDMRNPEVRRASTQGEKMRVDVSQVEILGYTLLSKQEISLSPLYVGCVYRNIENGKFFLKVRKMMYQIPFLLRFIGGSPQSGNLISLLDGTQSLQEPLSVDKLEQIIEHQETLIDLYPVFMRNQVFKKQHPKWESNFSVLTEIDEIELELEGVTSVIDFTSTVYSVESQEYIHLVCENEEGMTELRQVRVEQTFPSNDEFIGKIDLIETKVQSLDQRDALRIFQVDEKVCILGSQALQTYDRAELKLTSTVELEEGQRQDFGLSRMASVINVTDADSIYTLRNLPKFKNLEIPKQSWSLCITSRDKQIAKIPLSTKDLEEQKIDSQSTKAITKAIQMAQPVDLKSLPRLLVPGIGGLKVLQHPGSFKRSQALLNHDGSKFTRINFQKVTESSESPLKFQLRVNSEKQLTQGSHQLVKRAHIELSFTRRDSSKGSSDPIDLSIDSAVMEIADTKWTNLNSKVQKLPITVERLPCQYLAGSQDPCSLVTPDTTVFTSNYPCQVMIFKHFDGRPFIPTQVTLWSKVHQEHQHGYPIGQGLVFMANNPIDLLDSSAEKQFSNFSKQDFIAWKKKRLEQMGVEPLKPYEPIAFFDFGEQEKINLDIPFRTACRFLKVMPTAFRSQPINYAGSTHFRENNCELMFLGVSGYEVETLLVEGSDSFEDKNMLLHPSLQVPVNMTLSQTCQEDKELVQIAQVDQIQIKSIRTANPLLESVPPSSILTKNTGLSKLIGVASTSVDFEQGLMALGDLCIEITDGPELESGWELSGVNVRFEAYSPEQSFFINRTLNESQVMIRESLLGLRGQEQLEAICHPILQIINRESYADDWKITEAVKTISTLIVDPNLLRVQQRLSILKLIQETLDLKQILDPTIFIDQSSSTLQSYLWNLIELAGLRRVPETRKMTDQILALIFNRVSSIGASKEPAEFKDLSLVPLDVFKNVLNMIPRKRTPSIVKKVIQILEENIITCMTQWPIYFQLRAQLEVNAFPFDVDYLLLDEFNEDAQRAKLGPPIPANGLNLLPVDFEFLKINSFYRLNVLMRRLSLVKQIKLIFNSDMKSVTKLKVTISINREANPCQSLFEVNPKDIGAMRREVILVKTFDESMFTMLCDRAHQPKTQKFFDQPVQDDDGELVQINNDKLDVFGHLQPTYGNHLNQQRAKQQPLTTLNHLAFDLPGQTSELIGNQFTVQIELLDSYKRLHKSAPISQVLITPEFYGHEVGQEQLQPIAVSKNDDSVSSEGDNLVNLVLEKPSPDATTIAAAVQEKATAATGAASPAATQEDKSKSKSDPISVQPALQVINGTEYNICTGVPLPGEMTIENNKLFVMLDRTFGQGYPVSELSISPEDKQKSLANSFSKGAFLLNERVTDLRKFIEQSTAQDETAEDGQTVEDKEKDPKKLKKLLSMVQQFKQKMREVAKIFYQDCEKRLEAGDNKAATFKNAVEKQLFGNLKNSKNMCTLKYTFAFAEVACTYLNEIFEKDPKIIKDPQTLFKKLFKTFILSDKANSHPLVENFMISLYELGVPDSQKIKFQVTLIEDVLIHTQTKVSLDNFIKFIQSDKFDFISINELLSEYLIIFVCKFEGPSAKINSQEQANKLLIQSSDSRPKSKSMSTNRILAALSYLTTHIDYRARLDKAYPKQEEQDAFCPKISEKISANLFRRLIADHLLHCHNLHSGCQMPKASAFLLYFSNIYLQLAMENVFDSDAPIHEGDFLVILIAVVQSGSEQIQNNFLKAQLQLMSTTKSTEVSMTVINLLNSGLAFFESTEAAFKGKMYRIAKRNTGSGFPLLFSHLQVMFKIHKEILSHFEKGMSSPGSPSARSVSDQFSDQLHHANQKLEEFVLMLLENFNLSKEKRQLSSQLGQTASSEQQSSQIVIRLLVEIINALPIIRNADLKQQVIEASVAYYFSLAAVERESFVQRVTIQFEKLLAKKDSVEENITSMLQLLGGVLQASSTTDSDSVHMFITNDLCMRLLNIMLRGGVERSLEKRDMYQKRRNDPKRASLPLSKLQLANVLSILRTVLLTRCNLHTTKGTAGLQQSTVINLRLANRLCQLILYSHETPAGVGEVRKKATDLQSQAQEQLSTLKKFTFDDKEKKSTKELLFDLIQFIGLNYTNQVLDLASKKNEQLIKKLMEILTQISAVSTSNLKLMIPVLLQFVAACDNEIPKLIQAESIHDLQAVTLQENVNTVLKKMLKSWFKSVANDDEKQEEVFQFLSTAKGLKFLIARMQNLTTESPYLIVADKTQISASGGSKDDSSDESMDEDVGFNDDILKFVGAKIGLRLTKKDSISTSLVLKKNDHELLQAAKVVTKMRKQTAIFSRSPTKEFGLSPFALNKSKMALQDNDQETLNTYKSLQERNFAMSLQLVDCSKGDAETDKHKTSVWNRSRNRNLIATRIYMDPTKDLKNEFYLTFDLGQVVQLSEFQITFSVNFDMYNQQIGTNIKPQMVTIEGKKETTFVSSKHKSAMNAASSSENDCDITRQGRQEWQTQDSGDWIANLSLISDCKDQQEMLYTFGHSFHKNRNLNEMNIRLCGMNRREARYLRVRMLYSDQNLYTVPQSGESDLQIDRSRAVCYAINRISILGLPTKNSNDIRNLVLSLQKQNSVEVFMNMHKLATKAIYARIAASQPMIETFSDSFDNLQTLITKFPKAFLPWFVGIASQNDEFCDKLIQKKVLNTFIASPLDKNSITMTEKISDTLMEMMGELLLIRSERQGNRFQMILKFLLAQGDLMAFGGSDENDREQIDYNMKLAAVFAQCAAQIVQETKVKEKYHQLRGPSTPAVSADGEEAKNNQLQLTFNTADVKSIISFGRLLTGRKQVCAVASIVTFLLSLPAPFTNTQEVDLNSVILEELSMQEGSPSSIINENSVEQKTYELLLLSLLLHTSPDVVNSHMTLENPLLMIMAELKSYVWNHISDKSAVQEQHPGKNVSPFQIKVQINRGRITDATALELAQIVFNLSLSSTIVNKDSLREELVSSLYALVGLIEPNERAEVITDDGQDKAGKVLSQLSYVDLLPEKFVKSIIATIKMNMNRMSDLQTNVALKLQEDIVLADSYQQKYSLEASHFSALVIEPLLKFQNTVQVVINKHLIENERVVHYYKGMVLGAASNYSPLASPLLTEKYQNLFYELFNRQKDKTNIKQFKKAPCSTNWYKLVSFVESELNQGTFMDIQSKLSGQKNILILFEFTLQQHKMIGAYFTFGQLDESPNQKKEKAPQKSTVLNQPGDFMIIGKKDDSQVVVMPNLLPAHNKVFMHGGEQDIEASALVMESKTKPPQQKSYKAKNAQPTSLDCTISIGQLFPNQAFLTMNFKPSDYQCSLNYDYCFNFQKEYPNQFDNSSDNEIQNLFYSTSGGGGGGALPDDAIKLTTVEIWTWKPQSAAQSGPLQEKAPQDKKDRADLAKTAIPSDVYDDILVEPSRAAAKESHFYQGLSPYNVITQNLVLDVPLGTTLDQLSMKLEIDPNLNFMRAKATSSMLQISNQKEEIIQIDTKLSDLAAGGAEAVDSGVLQLLVSDKKRLPIPAKQSSHLLRGQTLDASDNLPMGTSPSYQLPIVEKIAAKGGMSTLVQSSLAKLRNEYVDSSLAQIWINFLTLYTDFFAPLPGFEQRYFKEERVDLMLQIMTKKFDGKSTIPLKEKESKQETKKASTEKTGNVPVVTLSQNDMTEPHDFDGFNSFNVDKQQVEATQKKMIVAAAAKKVSLAETLKEDSPEHTRQKAICEQHKKIAFDITRAMLEEEVLGFQESSQGGEESESKEFAFTKTCLSQNFFQCILDQLSDITRNTKRVKSASSGNCNDDDDDDDDDEYGSENEVLILKSVFTDTKVDVKTEESKKTDLEKDKKKSGAAKGVGYTAEIGKTWDVNAYLKNKEAKNQQIVKLIEVMQILADSCSDQVSPLETSKIIDTSKCLLSEKDEEAVKSLFLESCLLPILETALISGSILEMAKEYELYCAFLKLIKTFASKKALIPLLSDIGPDYQPRQRDSLATLLNSAADMSSVFQECLKAVPENAEAMKQDSKDHSTQLAQMFLDTQDQVALSVQQKATDQEGDDEALLASMSIPEAYVYRCSKYRLKRVSMQKTGGKQGENKLNHHYASNEKEQMAPSPKKLIRLAQEIADLTNSLPVEHTNAVFCIVDKQRVDYMKCIIMGSAGTPYAHGAFQYDIYFGENYPDGPPKINLTTTGGGTIRFNPNLYHCGKVCLSLLGTWRGSSTENWNPKVSTLLQVMLSIQAIIMSNEVYFNEPGYEHLMGTPQGEKLNNGYANIVRYGTLKYAILEQLKNPSAGFEEVIKESFKIKKPQILAEVDDWIKQAKTEPANYTDSLTTSHNSQIANDFNSSTDCYHDKLVELRKELIGQYEKIEGKSQTSQATVKTTAVLSKTTTEDSSQPKAEEDQKQKSDEEESKGVAEGSNEKTLVSEDQAKLDLVDMSYSPAEESSSATQKELNINDEGVKDRWSRYIGAMGIEAVAKQAEAVVYIDQLGGLGIEIAKNIILAGCKELILGMTSAPTFDDLSSQFFIDEKDVKEKTAKSKVTLCKQKLQELNPYVKVTALEESLKTNETCLAQRGVRIAIFTDPLKAKINNTSLVAWNATLRSQGIQMIVADQNGLFSRVITDFGENHTVIDKDGEDVQEVMVQQMGPVDSQTDQTRVDLLIGATHNLQEGDIISFKEVVGMRCKVFGQEDQTINSDTQTFKVTDVINRNSFVIDCDCSLYTAYERNGLAKNVKQKVQLRFAPLSDVLHSTDGTYFDEDLQYLDFCKIENFRWASRLYKISGDVMNQQEDQTKEAFQSAYAKEGQTIEDKEEKERFLKIANVFLSTSEAQFGPLCAFVGGLVSQEIVKAITGKFTPIRQEMYLDVMELFDEAAFEHDQNKETAPVVTRYQSLERCFGPSFVEKIRNAKVFMIGAGAIGCELLKNFAMVGLGTGEKGQITLTDPDIIELSNLNRQFLFREKHLRKPKSITAAAAAIQMNPDLKGHISARLDKLCKDTDHIYTEQFFKEQTVVANALDNVAARLFIDQKCVRARIPLLDSGTLGAKGHVQVIIPHKTESYGSFKDPEENNEIPHCTLKMFPEETLHCVEWAKDMLGSFFGVNPQSYNKLTSASLTEISFDSVTETKNIEKAIKIANRRPKLFADCIQLALNKFYKLFRNNILQLILVYPIDKVNEDGRPFWSLPKREPSPQAYDPANPVHVSFIAAYACLMANMYGVAIPYDQPRSEDAKQTIAQIAAVFSTPTFVPNSEKAKAIQSQVEKEVKKDDGQEDQEESKTTTMIDTTAPGKQKSPDELRSAFEASVVAQTNTATSQLKVEEFEKDDDQNFHVDFIYACANIRAMNYSLPAMDWLTVKLKAGKIVPALATTTAAVAGLQTIELLKLLKHDELPLDKFKNTFLNMAIPVLQMSEPGPSIKTAIKEGLIVDTWERWEVQVSKKTKLRQLIKGLESSYGLQARDVMYEATHLFFYALRQPELSLQQQPQMKQTLGELLLENVGTDLLEKNGYADLTITFVDPAASTMDEQAAASQVESPSSGEKILENIPTVRIILKKKPTQ